MKNSKHIKRILTGVTLVELLVVMAIMAVIAAFAIPRVRSFTKDRNIREAARVVGEMVVAARDRAVGDGGTAGLLIERNQNFTFTPDPIANPNDKIYYAATTLYQMRRVPNYLDDYGDQATIETATSGLLNRQQITISMPWEQVERATIRVDDEIRFNRSAVRYKIVFLQQVITADPDDIDQLRIEFDVSSPRPSLSMAAGRQYDYVIERKPRKIESSRVDLPSGHLIDLRYSGELDLQDAFGVTVPGGEDGEDSSPTKCCLINDTQPIEILFDSRGSISSIGFNGRSILPNGSVRLFITQYSPRDIDPTDDFQTVAQKILANPSSLWVNLNDRLGGVSLGYNAPPNFTGTVYDYILDARAISRDATNAAQ